MSSCWSFGLVLCSRFKFCFGIVGFLEYFCLIFVLMLWVFDIVLSFVLMTML